jgi:hypothetical protein
VEPNQEQQQPVPLRFIKMRGGEYFFTPSLAFLLSL